MAIAGFQNGLIPGLLHLSPDGKLLLTPDGKTFTRSVTPRFVALVADDLIQTRWGDWVSGSCSRVTKFAVAPTDLDLYTRFVGAVVGTSEYGDALSSMLVEKASNSDIWKCFTDRKESDYPIAMRAEKDLPSVIVPFELVFSTDEDIAKELSVTDVVALSPGWLGGMGVSGYYGVSIGTPDYTNTSLDTKDPYWPDNIFASAERGNTQGRGLLSATWADGGSHNNESVYKDPDTGADLYGTRLGVEYQNSFLVASELFNRLKEYSKKLGGRFFGDYHPIVGVAGAVSEMYMFVSSADLDRYQQEAEAASAAKRAKYGDNASLSQYENLLDILNASSQGAVDVDGGRMWSVVKADYVNGGGIGNMVLYGASTVCDQNSPCRTLGGWTYTCGMEFTSTQSVKLHEGAATTVPIVCRRYEYVTVNGLRQVACVSTSAFSVGTKLSQQLAPVAGGKNQVYGLIGDLVERLQNEVQDLGTQCSLLGNVDFYPAGLQNATYQPVPSNCDGSLMTPPTLTRYIQGRLPLEYHTTRQLRETIGMAEPDWTLKPYDEDGNRVPVEGTGEWFTHTPTGGQRVFDSYANQTDSYGRNTGESLLLLKAWSWDKFGDNLFRDRLLSEIETET